MTRPVATRAAFSCALSIASYNWRSVPRIETDQHDRPLLAPAGGMGTAGRGADRLAACRHRLGRATGCGGNHLCGAGRGRHAVPAADRRGRRCRAAARMSQSQLREAGVDLAKIRFVELPYDDTWLRDSGPITLAGGDDWFRDSSSPISASPAGAASSAPSRTTHWSPVWSMPAYSARPPTSASTGRWKAAASRATAQAPSSPPGAVWHSATPNSRARK